MSRIAVVGTGYVGLTAGACLAHLGHEVVCADEVELKVRLLRGGRIPIAESGLEGLVQAGLREGNLLSVVNAVAGLCEHVGANIDEILRGIGHDRRIGKDTRALLHIGAEHGFDFGLLRAVIEANHAQVDAAARKVERMAGGPLPGAYDTARSADVLCILTERPEFAAVDLGEVREVMATPRIVDARNLLDPLIAEAFGFSYDCIGLGASIVVVDEDVVVDPDDGEDPSSGSPSVRDVDSLACDALLDEIAWGDRHPPSGPGAWSADQPSSAPAGMVAPGAVAPMMFSVAMMVAGIGLLWPAPLAGVLLIAAACLGLSIGHEGELVEGPAHSPGARVGSQADAVWSENPVRT